MTKILAALFLLAWPSLAMAATTDQIFATYARGEYEQAARLGEAAHTPAGYAIAARAVLAQDMLRDDPCMECLKRAEALAAKAVALDPQFAFGQVWLAVALGYESRITGVVKARLADAPARSKAALDQAVRDDPKNAYAVSALGGWHIEVVKGGGATLAGFIYGASESAALILYDRAVKLAPENVAVHFQIAVSLAGFDPDKYHARIAAELKATVASPADTAYERKIQARAAELLTLLTGGDAEALAEKVRKYQGYP